MIVVMSNNTVILLKLQLFTVGYVSEEDLEEKKLLGSGGYAFAKLTEQEEIKSSIGVTQIFLGNVGRLNKDRFSKYYCKKCEKEYPGCPVIRYESPNDISIAKYKEMLLSSVNDSLEILGCRI